ncbi:RING-H2 finger protein ATL60 [Platanthera guangdongensis]|uniref:RING-H2 finger protein ATL60 n=1 Tax=Platanthera guangdongensis TaxID=2320717 RepID=A0ABR2N3X1_9ASPA
MSPPITARGTHGLPVAVSSAIMVGSVVVIFCLFIFFLILYLRTTLYPGANRGHENSDIYFDGGGGLLTSRRALHPAVLKSLPVSVFSSVDFKGDVECAVCLSDLADGEHFRLLPVCNHPFHTDCIDIWFSSNSTCPICRSTVGPPPKTEILNSSALPQLIGMGSMAMHVDGGSGEGSSRSAAAARLPGRIVAVYEPRNNAVENSASALQTGETPTEEVKVPTLVCSSSRGCCERGWDVEQGVPPPATTAVAGVAV